MPVCVFKECRKIGYSQQQLYSIASDILNYPQFLPYCVNARILSTQPSSCLAELQIGFPPLVTEKYTSKVTFVPFQKIEAMGMNSRLFNKLQNTWTFSQQDNVTLVDFSVLFEFKNPFYAHLSRLFFTQITQEMISSFEKRAFKLYGQPLIQSKTLSRTLY